MALASPMFRIPDDSGRLQSEALRRERGADADEP